MEPSEAACARGVELDEIDLANGQGFERLDRFGERLKRNRVDHDARFRIPFQRDLEDPPQLSVTAADENVARRWKIA